MARIAGVPVEIKKDAGG